MSGQSEGWIYGSIRIRALENRLVGKTGLERLLEAGTMARCVGVLRELGVEVITHPETGAFLREPTLVNRLRAAYREALSAAEDADFLKLWLYPYDCNNIKAAIKCFRRGVDARELLFDFGTVEAERLLHMVGHDDFSELPSPFREAAAEASEAFARTANPQWVDLILDRACYRAMLYAAEQSGVDFAVRLVREKMDLTNLMICLRLLRMGEGEAGRGMLENALLEGGTLPPGYLTDLYEGGETAFWERLAYSEYRSFALRTGEAGGSLTAAETAADNHWMQRIREARLIPYGAPPLIGYLLGSEYEVRNLRIVMAGVEAGLPMQTVRERIRESYV